MPVPPSPPPPSPLLPPNSQALAWFPLCQLNNVNLPVGFSYKLPAPIKRVSTAETVGDLVVRESAYMVAADMLIPFIVPKCLRSEYEEIFFNLYNVCPSPTYVFNGAWGDSYNVKFYVLDPPEIKDRLYKVTGSFRVQQVLSFSSQYTSPYGDS